MSKKSDLSGSCFLSRLASLPLVQSTKELYVSSKEKHVLLRKGLGVLEYGVTAATPAMESLVGSVPGSSALDMLACSYLEKLEIKWSALHEPPQELINNVKCNATHAIKSGVRKALRTYPGRQFIRSIDGMITWSENTLDHIQGEPPESTEPGTEPPGGDSPHDEVTTAPGVLVKVGVMTPLEAYVTLLRFVKRLLATVAGLSTQGCPLPPSQKGELASRRKVSPRKHASNKGVLQRMTGTALGMLGMGTNDDQTVGDQKPKKKKVPTATLR